MNPIRKLAVAGAIVGVSVAGGALGATAFGTAGAATSSTTVPSSTGSSTAPSIPPHGSAAHEAAETPVTGDAATKAQAAAVKYVGSGTAGDVTTDFTGDGYEVTVTKSDGTQVEVHLDSAFNAMTGNGGRGGHDCDGTGDGTGSSESSRSSTATSQ